MMEDQIKNLAAKAILDVVRHAPTMHDIVKSDDEVGDITQARFDMWLNYVKAVLKVFEGYIESKELLYLYQNIDRIKEENCSYFAKSVKICTELLDFDSKLLNS